MRPPRFNWDERTNQAVLHTPIGLNDHQVHAAKIWALKIYKQRYGGMVPGDRRDLLGTMIRYLESRKHIAQHIVGKSDHEVDRVLVGA
jgi:hypothetical protein